jgi:hypothetical protein
MGTEEDREHLVRKEKKLVSRSDTDECYFYLKEGHFNSFLNELF